MFQYYYTYYTVKVKVILVFPKVIWLRSGLVIGTIASLKKSLGLMPQSNMWTVNSLLYGFRTQLKISEEKDASSL